MLLPSSHTRDCRVGSTTTPTRIPTTTTNHRCHGKVDPLLSAAETGLSLLTDEGQTAFTLHAERGIPTRSRVEPDGSMMKVKGSNAEDGSRVLEVVKLVRTSIVVYRQINKKSKEVIDKHSGHVLQRAWKLLSRRRISHKE
jgi:hypothetical protein